MKNLKNREIAASPVIGVILMVVITVIAAAIIVDVVGACPIISEPPTEDPTEPPAEEPIEPCDDCYTSTDNGNQGGGSKGKPILYKIGFRHGIAWAHIHLGDYVEEPQDPGLWSEHPLFIHGYVDGYNGVIDLYS